MGYRYPQRVEIRYSLWLPGFALLLLVFGAVRGLFLLLPSAGSWTMPVAFIVLVVALEALAIWLIWLTARMMLRRRPVLIIDRVGIDLQKGSNPIGRISWDEIRGFKAFSVNNGQFIAVKVANPERHVRRARGLRRWMRSLDDLLFHSPIHINATQLAISRKELLSVLEHYLAESRRMSRETGKTAPASDDAPLQWG